MRLNGYRAKATSLNDICQILKRAKANIAEAEQEEFHRLLSEEVTFFVDNISVGAIPRPEGAILDAALASLREKIHQSEIRGIPSEYNLNTLATVIPGTSLDQEYTYFLFSSENPLLREAFAATEGIEEYGVDLDHPDPKNAEATMRAEKWNQLNALATDGSTIRISLTSPIGSPDLDKLSFADVQERAEDLARHNVVQRYMSIYACGKEIKPVELMTIMDRSLLRCLSEEGKEAIKEKQIALEHILPVITKDLIS